MFTLSDVLEAIHWMETTPLPKVSTTLGWTEATAQDVTVFTTAARKLLPPFALQRGFTLTKVHAGFQLKGFVLNAREWNSTLMWKARAWGVRTLAAKRKRKRFFDQAIAEGLVPSVVDINASKAATEAELEQLKKGKVATEAELEQLKKGKVATEAELEQLRKGTEAELEQLKKGKVATEAELEQLKKRKVATEAELEQLRKGTEAELEQLKKGKVATGAQLEQLKKGTEAELDQHKADTAVELDALKGIIRLLVKGHPMAEQIGGL